MSLIAQNTTSQRILGRQYLYEFYSNEDQKKSLKQFCRDYTLATLAFISATKCSGSSYDLSVHKFVATTSAVQQEPNHQKAFKDHLVHCTEVLAKAIFPEQVDKQEAVHQYFLSKLLGSQYASAEDFINNGLEMKDAPARLSKTLTKLYEEKFLSLKEKETKHSRKTDSKVIPNYLDKEKKLESDPTEEQNDNTTEESVKSVKQSLFIRFFKGVGNRISLLASQLFQWFKKLFL